jgi:adenosine deaminase
MHEKRNTAAAAPSRAAWWRSIGVAVLLGLPSLATAQQAAVALVNGEGRTARHLDSIRGDPVRLLLFLRAFPKGGDIHSHLSGAVYAETYIAWAAEAGLCAVLVDGTIAQPPCDEAGGRPPVTRALRDIALYGLLIDGMSMRNWQPSQRSGHAQFFGSFNKFRLVSGNTRTGSMLAEVAARAAAEEVSYLELMFTVDGSRSLNLGRSIGFDPDLERFRERLLQAGVRDTVRVARRLLDSAFARQRAALNCAAAHASPGCDVGVRILYQVGRAQPPEHVFAQLVLGFELVSADERVVGVNLVQPEDDHFAMRDYALHMRMVALLRRLYPNVRVALHAGELTAGLVPPEGLRFHIREAVRTAGAERIGHGVSVAYEDSAAAVLQEMARRNVLVEIALSSNDAILGVRGAAHPLRLYMAYDVPVTLATDDEGVLRSNLTLEYLKAVQEHGLGYLALKTMARNSLEYAFLPGESLWRDREPGVPVAACADARVPVTGGCRALIERSMKARLQWQLEQAFQTFEHRYAEQR